MAAIDPRYYYLTLTLLAVCTVVGMYFAFRLQREVTVDDSPPTKEDVLSPLEKAYYSGLMNEDEFRRIQMSMDKQSAERSVLPAKLKFPKKRVEVFPLTDDLERKTDPDDDDLHHEPETGVDPR